MPCIDTAYCYRCRPCSCWRLGTRLSCAKATEPIEMPFWADYGPKESCHRRGFKSSSGKGHLWGDTCQPTVTHECIRHCSLDAVGECSCPAHAADECVRHRMKRRNGDAAFCQITLDTCFVVNRQQNIAPQHRRVANHELWFIVKLNSRFRLTLVFWRLYFAI